MNGFTSLFRFLHYLFWPFIKLIDLLLPVLKSIRYLNPFLWKCSIFHGVVWQKVDFLAPFGIGGSYTKKGWWCQKCKALYCKQDYEAKHRGMEQSVSSPES